MFDHHKPRLLVIDDDAQIRRMYARMLGHRFDVESEVDGQRALRRLALDPLIDVILCDRNLGAGMSGQRLVDSLAADVQECVVMCSGADLDPDDPLAAKLGDRFYMKLQPISELVEMLLRVALVARAARLASLAPAAAVA